MKSETANVPSLAEEGRCHSCGEEILPVPTRGGIYLWRCQGCWKMYRTDQVYPSGIPAHVWEKLTRGC